jgi:hypothetical protein
MSDWDICCGRSTYIPSKCAGFGVKSFELCEAKSGYVWNFIVCSGQYTVFNESLIAIGSSTKSWILYNHEQQV